MSLETAKKFLIKAFFMLMYLTGFTIIIMIPFVPHIYVKIQGLNSNLTLEFTSLMEILDPVAIATIILALATFALAKDSSKNIKISKDNLLEEHFVKEMENLIKPIYMRRDQLENLEFVHIPYYDGTRDFQRWTEEAREFWDLLEADKYLASNDLRDEITDYSQNNDKWHKKQKELANRIEGALTREGKLDLCLGAPRDGRFDVLSSYFDYRFINLPSSEDKDERKQQIKELSDQLNPNSESFNLIKDFVQLIDDDIVLKDKRTTFKDSVMDRYEKLKKEIDEIRKNLENSS
jgi:hypothetical protein